MTAEAVTSGEKLLKESGTIYESFADMMSPEDAKRYLDFLENGSREGLTSAELAGVEKADALLVSQKVGYEDVWDLRNAGDALESGSKTVNGYDTKVNVGQQNKHIPGTNEYKNALNNGQTKSIMYGDANDIQNLLNDKAGTGDFIGANKERVNFGQVIGQYVDPDTGVGVETTIGIIHYGKKGAHIVPARPN